MRIKTGAIISEASGKLGGSVIQRSNGRLTLRANESRCKSKSNLQFSQQSIFRQVVTAWRLLSDIQRNSWLQASLNNLSGYPLFCSLNIYRLINGRFIANYFSDSPIFSIPSSVIQSTFTSSLGAGRGFIQYGTSRIICYGGSGQQAMYASISVDNWALNSNFYSGKSCGFGVITAKQTIIIGGTISGIVLRSIDGGFSYSPVTVSASITTFYSIVLSKNGSILACGYGTNVIWESSDDGISWHAFSSVTGYSNLYRMLQLPNGRISIIPYGVKRIVSSDDFGLSWFTSFDPGQSGTFGDMANTYDSHIFVSEANQRYYWISDDFGKHFQKIPLLLASGYYNVSQPAQKGILLARNTGNNYIAVSYDLGRTWFDWFKPTYQQYMMSFFATSDNWLYIGGFTYAYPIRGKLIPFNP